MKKQVFSVLLTLCMASSTMPATVFGAEEGSVAVTAEVSQQDDSAKDTKEAGSSGQKLKLRREIQQKKIQQKKIQQKKIQQKKIQFPGQKRTHQRKRK